MGKKTDRVLGTISPLYGAVSGRGAFGDLQQISPLGAAIGAATRRRKKDDDETPAEGMRKGGSVKGKRKGGSAKKVCRGDGICTRGRTKGRFR